MADALEKADSKALTNVLDSPVGKTLSKVDGINSKISIVTSTYDAYRKSDEFGVLLTVLGSTLGGKVPGVGEFMQFYAEAYVASNQALTRIEYINEGLIAAINYVGAGLDCDSCDEMIIFLMTSYNNECKRFLK